MAYRPYPSVDRALNQIGRHYPDPNVVPMSPALQSVGDGFQRIREGLRQAARQKYDGGAYVLSTAGPRNGQAATLSPGSVSPEVADRFPSEFIEQVNQAPRPGAVSGPS